jgi:hypothetical protein
MTMKLIKFSVPCMALLLAAAPTLRADTVTGEIWIVSTLSTGAVPDPTSSVWNPATANFTFTLNNPSGSVFNMNSNNGAGLTDYTVNGFLTSGGDMVTYASPAEAAAAATTLLNSPSGCHDASPTLCTTNAIGLFTGMIQTPFSNVEIFHDDGFILTVGGVTEATFPAKTDEEMNLISGPAGMADLYYAEVSGAPAVLTTALDVGAPPVPEPSTIALFGTGLLAAAGIVRRRLAK